MRLQRVQRLRRRDLRHRQLVIESLLEGLKRGGQVEDLRAVLNGDHAARGKVIAVARPVHLVDDGRIEVAATQEIGVQRVRGPALHRGRGRHERFAENLAAEDLRAADVAALAAKQVELESLERHDLEQILEQAVHAGSNANPPGINASPPNRQRRAASA